MGNHTVSRVLLLLAVVAAVVAVVVDNATDAVVWLAVAVGFVAASLAVR